MNKRVQKATVLTIGLLFSILISDEGIGAPLTIVHTNDLHSHLLGYGPNMDYSPDRVNDDETVGGLARISTVIEEVRKSRGEGVLVLDAGDFLMGSLFHTVCREEGGELSLLGALGYDAVTLGNHELDLKPEGLASVLTAAKEHGAIPAIVAANFVFDSNDPRDDALEKAFGEVNVEPYRVFHKAGLKIGVFGLMGQDAAEVAPFSFPVSFADPVKTARRVVRELRERERVDLVVCLSHGGISEAGEGEDAQMAREVPGIDVVVSGHTHTVLNQPIKVEDTLIVQAGYHGRHVGILDLEVEERSCRLSGYRMIEINDSILGDPQVQARVEALRDSVEKTFLAPKGLRFEEPLAKLDFSLTTPLWGEANLGDLLADAIRWAIDERERDAGLSTYTQIGVESNGLLRDPILPGNRGPFAVCDLFRAFPLGFGPDGQMGYPLLSFYLKASEVRKTLEIITTVASMKGPDYVLQLSGVRFVYNPNRVPFDRVEKVWILKGNGRYAPLDTSSDNPALYKVGANLYNSTFLKIIGRFTHGILTIVPKDRNGRPIEDLKEALVDGNPGETGLQELKEWQALLAYIRQFPDVDGDGLPEVPARYAEPQGRMLSRPSWNPLKWFHNAHWITFLALGVGAGALLLLALLAWVFLRVIRKRR